jgi:serine/threonine-protein kinase PknG
VALLVAGRPAAARDCFDAVYDLRPGEPAVKLALAASAECAGDDPTAATYFDRVWRTDHHYVSAAFGLARVLRRGGDRAGAVQVLRGVPEHSRHHVAAQLAAIRARTVGRASADLSAAEVVETCSWMAQLDLDHGERARLSVDVLTAALNWVLAGRPGAGPDHSDTVLGCRLTERDLRFGLERSYRALARLAETPAERIALVDRANAVRPRTWF